MTGTPLSQVPARLVGTLHSTSIAQVSTFSLRLSSCAEADAPSRPQIELRSSAGMSPRLAQSTPRSQIRRPALDDLTSDAITRYPEWTYSVVCAEVKAGPTTSSITSAKNGFTKCI